ncbi:DUF488 family protein [Utexia brackfieldae]|uniref:DUF488 domain-containing protein n=1 Tax=Utexia brackfieldae TaxID=3074108 RepID=UPI00370D37BA
MQIQLKRVYAPALAEDGLRVLVDRLWPRGIKKVDLAYDIWAKTVAPSAALRKWYHDNPALRWDDFKQQYWLELKSNAEIPSFVKDMLNQKVVTLLYAAKDEQQNHAIILKSFLESVISADKTTKK